MFSLAIVIMAERSRELRCGPMPLEPLEGNAAVLIGGRELSHAGNDGRSNPRQGPKLGLLLLHSPKQRAALIAYSMSQPPDLAPGVAP